MTTPPEETMLYPVVNLTPQYRDQSYLRTNPLLSEPLEDQGVPIPASQSDEVIRRAISHIKALLDVAEKAKTKTRPSLYVFPLSLTARYSDGREANSSHQLITTNPDEVVQMVEDWFKKEVERLIEIGSDDVWVASSGERQLTPSPNRSPET